MTEENWERERETDILEWREKENVHEINCTGDGEWRKGKGNRSEMEKERETEKPNQIGPGG